VEERVPSGRPRSYHRLGLRREVTVRAFARYCAIEVFAARIDARDPLHIVGRRSLEAYLRLQCSRPGGEVCWAWTKVEHEWPMNRQRTSMTDERSKTGLNLQRRGLDGVSSSWSLPRRLPRDHRCYPPFKERGKTPGLRQVACMAFETGQETTCPDQNGFWRHTGGRVLRKCTSVRFVSSRSRIESLLHDLG
jgi:hypothetical protein